MMTSVWVSISIWEWDEWESIESVFQWVIK